MIVTIGRQDTVARYAITMAVAIAMIATRGTSEEGMVCSMKA